MASLNNEVRTNKEQNFILEKYCTSHKGRGNLSNECIRVRS